MRAKNHRMAMVGFAMTLSFSAGSPVTRAEGETRSSPQKSKRPRKPDVDRARSLLDQIVESKERASGRSFAPGYRRQLAAKLSNALTMDELERAAEAATAPPASLGESSADLVFTPLTPCRILDTRLAGGVLAANTTREFYVAGPGLDVQGGEALGCGVPFGPATAAALNVVAVTPSGPGNVVAFAWDESLAPPPNASLVNFGAVLGQNAFANGVIVPLCDPFLAAACDFDLLVRGRVSDVHLVVDVVGYFSFADIILYSESGGGLSITGLLTGDNYIFESLDLVPEHGVTCVITATLALSSAGANTADLASGLSTALQDVTAGTNDNDASYGEWASYLPVGEHGTVSKTSFWDLSAGGAYRFGCYVSAFGPYVGDEALCSVAYVCR